MLGIGLGLNKNKTSTPTSLSPADFGTLHAWYTFDSEYVSGVGGGDISENAIVESVLDRSGNGFTLTEHPSTGDRPRWIESGINSIPSLTYLNTASLHNNDVGFLLSQPTTIAIVYKLNSSSVNNIFYDSGVTGSRRQTLFVSSGSWATFAGATLDSGVAFDISVSHYVTCIYAPTSLIYLDGVQIGSGDAGTQGLDGITLGSRFNMSEGIRGEIAEFIIWDGELTGANLTNANLYLATKFGL